MTIVHETYNDIRDRLVRLPHGDPYGGMSYVREDLFTVRHDLIRELDPAPTSVFEFGALVGYFLVTALDAAPSIERVGWVDNESHSPGSNAMCTANIACFAGWWTTLDWRPVPGNVGPIAASRDDERLAGRQFDLVAVDSDHSYEGALADLRAAHELNPRWIFLDDWTAGSHGDDIHAAVETFLESSGEYSSYAYDVDEYVTVNGLAVLTRKDWA